ncbi:phosphoenolpyruvate synthase [Rhodohalobacter sp. 8-1]|uniref:phosphoenolpyruvate synthase n=1 Tax=Rhodohalobacter sp. 8-1 TaxID=3131972 RepID=UPI0030EE34F2
MPNYIYPFNELNQSRVEDVGGKNASLGEMFRELSSEGIRVPDGFATSAEAYWKFIDENELKDPIGEQLEKLDREEFSNLKEIGKTIRSKIMNASMPEELIEAIKTAYQELEEREKDLESVAIRSSATAEDLPEASFAGQHESYLNIKGGVNVANTVQNCYASLFTDRAIKYREDNDFDHLKIALSAGVQKMVRADKSCSGVAFTIEPDNGFEDVIFINGSWGLGDYIVGGEVLGDQFYLYKRNLKNDKLPIISKSAGKKEKKLIYSETTNEDGQNTKDAKTTKEERLSFILSDEEVEKLGKWCLKIEEHYGKPMDIEWAKDGNSGEIYIVQARPETVHSSKEKISKLKQYSLKDDGKIIATGKSIGDKIAAGKARILQSPEDSDDLEKGDVLITEITNPDWDPLMKKASAIVTNSGGRTSHAAIVARELGAVAVVGAEDATEKIRDGQEITVSCAEGQTGKIYEGILEWEEEEIDTEDFADPDTDVELILADPELAFQYASYPVDGVGLVRLEFAINNSIKVHPLALVHFDELEDDEAVKEINELTAPYGDKENYFVEKLSMAVGTIAAAFYPREVIVRMSDFKSNEYADLLGGKQFEPDEENPMLGFRGASRYTSDQYREGFRLECLAMKRARNDMGLDNIKLMIPFCRTVDQAKEVVKEMKKNGLKQGENGLELFVMVEIPSNVIGLEDFAEVFDGFSIGSNDLTQLTLGVDRDSELVSNIFDERNAHVRKTIAEAIEKAKNSGKKIGLCGQAPSDFPEYAQFLVEKGIDSISFNPDAIATGIKNILKAEGKD